MALSPDRVDGERAALLLAALAGTAAGLAAAAAGTVPVAAVVAGRFADDPAGVVGTGIGAIGELSAAHLPATAIVVALVCAIGAGRGGDTTASDEPGALLWRYAVAAVLGLSLAGAVASTGLLRTALWGVYAVLAAVYLGESWRGAGRYPVPRLARWLLAVSGVLPVLLIGFSAQYSRTVLAPLYRAYGGVPALALVAALPAAALLVLTTAAVARRIGG